MDLRDAELSIVITDDPSIRELNLKWRDKDRATDVLSFSQREGEGSNANGGVLGDVVISIDTAERQAEVAQITVEEEIARLLVHGVLHLLGHDHAHGGAQARQMKREETRLLELIEAGLR